jgi:hypothetical protein
MITREKLEALNHELQWNGLLRDAIDEGDIASSRFKIVCGETVITIEAPSNRTPLIEALKTLLERSNLKLVELGFTEGEDAS